MKIINTQTKEILDIVYPDFLRNIINGTIQSNKYDDAVNTPIILQTTEELTNQINKMIVNHLLTLTEYDNYEKLNAFDDWSHSDCPERAFFTFEQITSILETHKELIDAIFAEPMNPFEEFNTGRLIYFWTIQSTEVKALLNSMNITIESKDIE